MQHRHCRGSYHRTFAHIAHAQDSDGNRSLQAGVREPFAHPQGDNRTDITNGLRVAHFHLYNNILEVTCEECIETAHSQSVFLPRLTGDRALCEIAKM